MDTHCSLYPSSCQNSHWLGARSLWYPRKWTCWLSCTLLFEFIFHQSCPPFIFRGTKLHPSPVLCGVVPKSGRTNPRNQSLQNRAGPNNLRWIATPETSASQSSPSIHLYAITRALLQTNYSSKMPPMQRHLQHKHLITECPLYTLQRSKLVSACRPRSQSLSLATLIQPSFPAALLIQFLTDTGIINKL